MEARKAGGRGFCGSSRREFIGNPVVESAFPLQGAWVQSLVRELGPHMLQGVPPLFLKNTNKKIVQANDDGGLNRGHSG